MEQPHTNIEINIPEILLGAQNNTKKLFPHIMVGRKEKFDGHFHQKPLDLSPQKYVTMIFVNEKERQRKLNITVNSNYMRVCWN